MNLRRGGLGHQLLSVAGGEAQTAQALMTILEARGQPPKEYSRVSSRMCALVEAGYLTAAGPGVCRYPYRYTLTPLGGQELDRLAGQQ